VVTPETQVVAEIGGDYKYGFSDPENYVFKSRRGLSSEVVEEISAHKDEPDWMRKFRLKSLEYFRARPLPQWGGNLNDIDFENIYYYIKPTEKQAKSWEDLPPDIKQTWDRLGIPEAERKFLAGVGAQYESEVVYHKLKEELEEQGVLFLDMDSGLREHEELVRQYFGTIIPQNDNKFAALNSAVWSGGSFIYVPPGVKVDMPLQAYFRINAENMGQFERTLIIVDEGAYVHYVEGCTAPIYSTDSLHSAVVEIIVKPGARCRYTTIQNWSQNVYNLVTKRAVAHENATMEWVDGNLGSKLTMKYPAIWLMGEGAHGEVLSIAFAGEGQHRPRRAAHELDDHVEVDLEERRARELPRSTRGGEGRRRLALQGCLRCADPRRGLAHRHVSLHPHRRERRRRWTRGDGFEDRRGAALLSHESRPHGGGSGRDDRVRLRRADHEGASARVRGRDEPAHSAADGRVGWLGPPR
jgi:Fe-S cluster assembly protein SufB